jgi:hypothetical protein
MMRRFTDDEGASIVRDYEGYVPTDEIAAKIRRTEQTVRRRIKRLGLHRRWTDDAAQADERAHAIHAAQAAEIDSDNSLPRNQKTSAMRALGFNNEEIAKHYRITRDRVRQITDPDYKASPTKLSPTVKLAPLEEGGRRRAPASSRKARNGSWDSGA